ncbi:MAG: methyltransferase domain-containing protein [Pseudomonadota bacterium]
MHLDVVDLRSFYYGTRLGRSAQRSLQGVLRGLWPDVRGRTVVGFGFAAPLLRPFLGEAARVLSLMPAPQGVMPWPAGGENLSTLIEETRWPLGAGSADILIVAHGLETCERPNALLEEIWRVLAPEGHVAFIVPNRSGLWARRDGTPFGYGRPYSFGQLEAQLRAHGFVPERHAAALYAPPSHRRFWLRSAPVWERAGRHLDVQRLAGAILVEATKEVWRLADRGSKVGVHTPVEVFGEVVRPVPQRGAAARGGPNRRRALGPAAK